MSTVIIGNGPSVGDKPLGKQIDAYDVVVRINLFQIQGYEEYTGVRTSWWCFPDTLWGRFAYKHNPVGVEKGIITTSDPRHKEKKRPLVKHPFRQHVKVPVEFTQHLRNSYQIWPTTGAVLVYYLIEFGFFPVVLHGFDLLFDTFRDGHYMDTAPMSLKHSIPQEHIIFRSWLKEGKITTLDPEHRDALYSPR